MKPGEGIYSGMRDVHLDPCNYFISLGTLIVEGRSPSLSERGHTEGPHCSYNVDEHKCNLRVPECQQYDGLVRHLQLLWRHAIPMCIEVLLYPECCMSSFGSHTVDAFPAPDIPYVLLEQWSVQIIPKRMSSATVSPQTLIQAMRSFLHFSQLSAWLNLSSGKSPNNICYRICLPDEVFSSKFSGDYTVHTFPLTNINNTSSVKVSVKLHPRQHQVPVQCCWKHERKRPLRCNIKISDKKESESSDRNDSKHRLVPCAEKIPLTTVHKNPKTLSINHITKPSLNTSNDVSKCVKGIQSLSPLKEKLPDCFIYLPLTMLRNLDTHCKHRPHLKPRKHLNLENLQHNLERHCNLNGLSMHKQKCLEDIIKSQEKDIKCNLNVSPNSDSDCIINCRSARDEQDFTASPKTGISVLQSKKSGNSSDLPKTCLRLKLQEINSEVHKTNNYAEKLLPRFPKTADNGAKENVVFSSQTKTTSTSSIGDVSKTINAHEDTPFLHCKNDEISMRTSVMQEKGKYNDLPDIFNMECAQLGMQNTLPSPKDLTITLTQEPEEHERIQLKKFNKTIVLHPSSDMPLSYSPAPVRKSGNCFDFDSSLTSISAIKGALFGKKWNGNTTNYNLLTSPFSCTGSNRLLINFEETVLNGCLGPVNDVEGFTAEIGASGSFCPSHEILPVTVFFYNLQDVEKVASPYLGHINLGDRGYRVPRDGTVQLTLFNPHGTVVKMFVVRYDLSDMPPHSQTFMRQRTLYMPTGATENHPDASKWLRYLIHLRFASTRSGKIYLHTDVRIIILSKMDMDAATLHNQCRYELRSFTQVPANPKFSPRC